MRRTILGLLLVGLLPTSSHAVRGVENYPKVLTYSMAMNLLPPAVQDTLSWFDVIVCMDRPETIGSLRQSNPGQRYLWQIMPQYAEPPEGENPWWMPDTLWSIKRLLTVYAERNDWYLRDTSGERIFHWNHYVLNWTRHCPVGTFGSSRGMRAAEWMASVALPTIALSGRGWDPWNWDSQTAYNGYMFEILADCLGSYGWQTFAQADPDRDGEAEGVYSACSAGGSEDPLSVLFREENDLFYQRLAAAFPQDFVFAINENNSYIGPSWTTGLSGMKFENWMSPYNPSWHDWWDWFYGLTPPWLPGENWGAGYAWAEAAFNKPVSDRLRGWDISFIETWKRDGVPASENLQQMRWGLGTSMLGEGYFCYTYDQRWPLWQPEFDYDFGSPLGSFQREIHGSTDTLYVRLFDAGMVEVNPNSTARNGVLPHDSRFTFWLPVEDLSAEVIGAHEVRASWTAPVGSVNQADSYELRYATVPLTVSNWPQATPFAGNPVVVPPGSPASVEIQGLSPGFTYHFAIRTETRGRLEPILSNQVEAVLGETQDTTPPGIVLGLQAIGSGETWIDLTWTAAGDDGDWGTAAFYFLRTLVGQAIQTEDDWSRAMQAENLPPPGPPGAPESYRLAGLDPATSYGIAIRARDEAGNLSPLHPPFSASTAAPPPPPPDTEPPAALTNLAGTTGGPGSIELTWSAPGDDGWDGQASAYQVRLLTGSPITSEAGWNAAFVAPVPPPSPGPPMSTESLVIDSLDEGQRYGVAIRASDEAGNLAPLSNPLLVEAGESIPPPPEEDTIPPGAIGDLHVVTAGDTFVVLSWTATGDDGEAGTADAYDLRLLPGETIDDEDDWLRAATPPAGHLPEPAPAGSVQSHNLGGLTAGQAYGAALRARDGAGNLGLLGPPLLIETAVVPPIDGEPPERIVDLEVVGSGTASILLRWTAPAESGETGRAALYHLKIGADGTEEDRLWDLGTEIEGPPAPGAAGAVDSFRVVDLPSGGRFGFVLRSEDPAGNLSDDSNVVWGETDPLAPPPPVPPAAIADLRLVETGPDTARVAWTAPGDDGTIDRALRYHVRIRREAPLTTEEEWGLASVPDTAGLGRPATAGTPEEWTVRGLSPGTTYALAIRAEDDSSLVGALSNRFEWTTATPPPAAPPGPVVDLASTGVGGTWCDLAWTAPGGAADRLPPDRYRLALREGERSLETEEDWVASLERSEGLPSPAKPGTAQSARLSGLSPAQTYTVALRCEDALGRLGEFGAPVFVTTAAADDSIDVPDAADPPPAPIVDLAVAETGPDWVDLTWTAVGEDSLAGVAAAYRVRTLLGEPIATLEGWERADPVEGSLPDPSPAGTAESMRLARLAAGETYGIAVRAVDAAGQLSAWLPGVVASTRTGEPSAMLPVEGFTILETTDRAVTLEWTHPEDPESDRGPARFLVGLAPIPIDLANWESVPIHPDPPAPAGAGVPVRLVWGGLAEGTTYWAAVRAERGEGLLSPLSPIRQFTTLPLDLAPPDPPTDLRIAGTSSEGRLVLVWLPSSSPDVVGYRLYGLESGEVWISLTDEMIPASTTTATVEPSMRAYALTAVDAAGNEGIRSGSARIEAAALLLDGPFPHPVTSGCRFEIEIPPAAASERVVLRVRDLGGRLVRTLYEGIPGPTASLQIEWDRCESGGRRAAPGFYLVTLDASGARIHRRIFLAP